MSLRFFGIHDFASEGKFLWELLSQLKGMGVGRYVTKNEWMLKWPEEASYLKIIKARPRMDRWLQEGTFWAEWTFRGRRLGIYEFDSDLNRSDWILIHKHDEKKFTENSKQMELIKIPSTFPIPPLQQHLISKWVEKFGMDSSMKQKRAPLDVCLDPQFEMLRQFISQTGSPNASTSIYDEIEPEVFLSLYGNMLPTKIDSWSTEPNLYQYRFAKSKKLISDK